MASGYEDSANVLYYSNVNYNSGTDPKSSYVMTNLGSRFLNNQSNYEVAINKLKVSSLEGVRMGYVPYNQWQVGLTLPNTTGGGSTTANSYVNLPDMVPITAYYEYYTTLDRNYNVVMYQGNGTSLGEQLYSFVPKDNAGNQITPFYAVYNPKAQIYWAVSYRAVYVYDDAGNYLASLPYTNIRSASFSVNTQDLIIAENQPNGATQNIWNIVYSPSSGIGSRGVIGLQKNGQPLTDVRCGATDGETIVFVWFNTSNNSFYCDTASYATFQISNEGQLDTNITNPISVVVNTLENSFVIANDEYNVLQQLSANINQSWIGIGNQINCVNVATGAEMMNVSGLTNVVSSFVAFDDQQTVFATAATFGGPISSLFQGSLAWNSITPAAWNPSIIGGSNFPSTIAYYPTPNGMPLLLGIYAESTSSPTSQFICIGANGAWVPCNNGTIPNNNTLYWMLSTDNFGTIWLTDEQNLYKWDNTPTFSATAPYLTFSGSGNWIQVNQSESSHTIISVVWDTLLTNIGYALTGEDNIIYKILYNPQANTITMQEFHADSNLYKGYLTKCWNYSGQVNNSNIVKYNITSFAQTNSITITNTYIANLSISRPSDLLYVPNTSNSILTVYNYADLLSVGQISNFPPFGGIGVYTSQETTPPSLASTAFNNLQTIVDAVNAAYLSCYNTLKTSITPMPVSTPPSFSLSYSTHRLTMTYDPKWDAPNSAISVNDNLLRYFLFSSVKPTAGIWNNYVLSASGTETQSKETMYLLNTVDKLIIKTNMSLLTDYTGTDTSTTVFTDLDFDTQNQFFNMSGDFIYSAILLRNYCMISNQQLRSISYQLFIAYLDGSETELLIPAGQNASIKFQFSRIY